MRIINREELMKSKGIGASDVPIICHESPFQTAYGLWQIKTKRVPKPPQTAAMLAGLELEPASMAEFIKANGGLEWQQQVISVSDVPFLRAVADGWRPETKLGVNVKSPSSDKLANHIGVPRHYLLQYAAEMFCFGATAWYQYVYTPGKPGKLDRVTWNTRFNAGKSLGEFWGETALPMVKEFWERVLADEWWDNRELSDLTANTTVLKEWDYQTDMLADAVALKSEGEDLEDEAKAALKRLTGNSRRVQMDGWQTRWQSSKPGYEVKVKCNSEADANRICEMLQPLLELKRNKEKPEDLDVNCVTEIKTAIRREGLAFYVEPVE